MSKEMHTVRVWAWRDGARELAFSVDAPEARRAALAHVRTLQEDPSVNRIEMREHTVTSRGDDEEYAGGVRGSLVWIRTDGRWRSVGGGNVHRDHQRV